MAYQQEHRFTVIIKAPTKQKAMKEITQAIEDRIDNGKRDKEVTFQSIKPE